MSDPLFRVGYIEPAMYPSFAETLAAAPGVELVRIDATEPVDRVEATLATCHGYYVKASRAELPAALHVGSALLARLPQMLVVASYGAGYDTIDVAACTAAGVAAVNQAGGNARAVAEHAVGMMMALLKRIPEAQAAMRAGTVGAREAFMGHELADKTVGIVGLGNAGSCTARLVKAFGCTVLACDPYLDAATCADRGARKVELAELLARSDVVSMHCPLTAQSRALVGAAQFAAMPRGAIFVNTSRGGTYDEAALDAALSSGHLGGAGIDVWEQEPPAPDHPLLRQPALLASPHTAGVTHESRARVATMAAEAFIAAASGRLPPRCLNPEVADRFLQRLDARPGWLSCVRPRSDCAGSPGR